MAARHGRASTCCSSDGRIASIGVDAAEALLTIDGRGLFAMPGLTDAHVHLSGLPWAERADQLKRVLRGGVTMVYDVASDLRNTSDLSRAALTGEIEAPSIAYAALFAGPAFFTDPRVVSTSRGYRPGDAPWNREIGPDTDLVRVVAEARGAGATSIKLYAALDGAAVRRIGDEGGAAAGAPDRACDRVPREAERPGRRRREDARAHRLSGVGRLAADARLPEARARRFCRCPADSPVMTRLLQSMKDNDVTLNPTLWIFADGPAKDDMSALRTPWMNTVTKRAQDMGVVIAAGVDSLTTPRRPVADDPQGARSRGGRRADAAQAITSATRGAAHAIGVDAARGTVAAGKIADLLIVDGRSGRRHPQHPADPFRHQGRADRSHPAGGRHDERWRDHEARGAARDGDRHRRTRRAARPLHAVRAIERAGIRRRAVRLVESSIVVDLLNQFQFPDFAGPAAEDRAVADAAGHVHRRGRGALSGVGHDRRSRSARRRQTTTRGDPVPRRWNGFLAGYSDWFTRIDDVADFARAKAPKKVGIMLTFQDSTHFRGRTSAHVLRARPADLAADLQLQQPDRQRISRAARWRAVGVRAVDRRADETGRDGGGRLALRRSDHDGRARRATKPVVFTHATAAPWCRGTCGARPTKRFARWRRAAASWASP